MLLNTPSNRPASNKAYDTDTVPVFMPNIFWDNIIQPRKYLNLAYRDLRVGFSQALANLVPEIPATESNRKKLQVIAERMGRHDEFIKMAYEANSILVNYGNFIRKKKEYKEFIVTNTELESIGMTETVFKKILLQVSRFIANFYGMSVPEEVLKYCEGVDISGPVIPTEELERISLKNLRDNYGSALFPCVIIIDNAIYMTQSGQMDKLTEGINDLLSEITSDKHLSERMELFIATTGKGPQQVSPFSKVESQIGYLESYSFKPFGPNNMSDTLNYALDALEKRLEDITRYGSRYYTPWFIVLSNGKWNPAKNADMPQIAARLKEMHEIGRIQLYVRSLSKIDEEQRANLRMLSEDAQQLNDVNGFFKDIYNSLHSCTNSSPGGERVQLVNRYGFN